MKTAQEYSPTKVSHPVESLKEFFDFYLIDGEFDVDLWRKRIDDYAASIAATNRAKIDELQGIVDEVMNHFNQGLFKLNDFTSAIYERVERSAGKD